jgi:hypothetical protein
MSPRLISLLARGHVEAAIKAFHGARENAVKTQIWIALSIHAWVVPRAPSARSTGRPGYALNGLRIVSRPSITWSDCKSSV